MSKKFGGTIKNWQLHTLLQGEENMKKAREHFPEIKTDKVYKMSGTVVEDPLGRWEAGFHMISSMIVNIDREEGIVETINTIYKVQDEGNDALGDMGPDISRIFY